MLIVIPTIAYHSFRGYAIFNTNLLFVPLIVLGVLLIFNASELPLLKKIMITLGDYSMWMWWLHSLFFCDNTSWLYARFVDFADGWQPLFSLWTIILTFLFAVAVDLLYKNLLIKPFKRTKA